MTNEQTALLLRQLADRVRALADDIEPLIESGEMVDIEELQWIGQWPTKLPQTVVVGSRPAAVQRILDLADEAELLRSNVPELAAAD